MASPPRCNSPRLAAALLCLAAVCETAVAAPAGSDWREANASLIADSQVFLCEPRWVWRTLKSEASCAGSYDLPAGKRLRVVGLEVAPKPESLRIQWLRDGHVFTGWIVGPPERLVVADHPGRLFLPDLPPDERLLDSLVGTWALDAEALRTNECWDDLESGTLKLVRDPRQGILGGTLEHVHDLQRQSGDRMIYSRELRASSDRWVRIVQPVEATLSGNVLTIVGGKPRVLHVGSRRFYWVSDHMLLRVGGHELTGIVWHELHAQLRHPVRLTRLSDAPP